MQSAQGDEKHTTHWLVYNASLNFYHFCDINFKRITLKFSHKSTVSFGVYTFFNCSLSNKVHLINRNDRTKC